jgi:hypothetical protein
VILESTAIEGEGERRGSVLLGRGDPSAPPRSWRDDLGSPSINLNPLETSVVEVTARKGTDLTTLEEVTWTSTGGAGKGAALAGVWFEDREEPFGVFDLGATISWRLSERVRGIFFESGTRPLALVELREELRPLRPALVAERRDEGRTWIFAPVTDELVLANLDRGRFVLSLLDVATFRLREFDVERRPDGVLWASIRREEEARVWRGEERPLAWSLEFRIGDRAIARSRGRVAEEEAREGEGR